jgi:hypothetical protein
MSVEQKIICSKTLKPLGVVQWLIRLPKTASLAQVGEDSNGRDSDDEHVITQKSNTKFLIN